MRLSLCPTTCCAIAALGLAASKSAPRRVKTKDGFWYEPRYPALFDDVTGPRPGWFDRELMDALANASSGNDVQLKGLLRREHPKAYVYSFPFLRPRFAKMLLEEAQHYNMSGLPLRKPNGMNNYGILWNDVGMDGMFRKIQERFIAPIARLLFPHLGGASLDHQHTYLVKYSVDQDSHGLDVHHDSCDITFNAALDEASEYEGCGLTFCGLYSTVDYREYTFTYRHVLGRAIIYDGRQRHGAEPIVAGVRTNLVMWSHSSEYRRSAEYDENNRPRHSDNGRADPRCVSYHHDEDYCKFRLTGHTERCSSRGINKFKPAWRKALDQQKYWEVGAELQDASSGFKVKHKKARPSSHLDL